MTRIRVIFGILALLGLAIFHGACGRMGKVKFDLKNETRENVLGLKLKLGYQFHEVGNLAPGATMALNVENRGGVAVDLIYETKSYGKTTKNIGHLLKNRDYEWRVSIRPDALWISTSYQEYGSISGSGSDEVKIALRVPGQNREPQASNSREGK